MKKIIIIICCVATWGTLSSPPLLAPVSVNADETGSPLPLTGNGLAETGRVVNTGDIELGVLLGEPTGIGGKIWTGWNTGIDFGMAWSFAKDGYLHAHAGYVFHNFNTFQIREGELPAYFGVGGRIRFDHDLRVGLRMSLGMEYYFDAAPVGLFMEIAPVFDFTPETEAGANGGIGVRYIF